MDKLLIAPFTKIDKEQRIVSGYATLEVPDKTSPTPEVVDYDSAKAAFAGWIGNIREMHLPIAVGKAIEVVPDDAKRGIFISAQISKSRDGEDAWTKVTEGILTAFSIGAKGVTRSSEVWKSAGKNETVHRVKITTLAEVSLVDNPACPGTFFDVVKATMAEEPAGSGQQAAGSEPEKKADEPPCEPEKQAAAPDAAKAAAESGSATAEVLGALKGILASFANRADVVKLAEDMAGIRGAVATLTAAVDGMQQAEFATKADIDGAKALSADRAEKGVVSKVSEDLAKALIDVEVAKANLADLVRRVEIVERSPLPAKVALRTDELSERGLHQAEKANLPDAVKAVHAEIAHLEKRIDEATDPREREKLGDQAGQLRMRLGLL